MILISRWLPVFAVFSFVFLWVLLVPNEPISDQAIYHSTAAKVADGQGLLDDSGAPTAYWAPGYTFYLAFFYYLFGVNFQVGFLANFLSYISLVAGVFCLSRIMYGDQAARISVLITAAYPTFMFYTTILASELLFCTLIVWALYFSWRMFTNAWFMPLSGIFLGSATLVRPPAEVLPLAIPLIGWAIGSSWKKNCAFLLGTTLIGFIFLLPWGLRNQRELGQFVLVSANSGANLWMGNHSGSSGGHAGIEDITKEANIDNIPLPERDAALRKIALDFIVGHPLEFLKLVIKRAYMTMKSESIGVVWNQVGLENKYGRQVYFFLKIVENLFYYMLVILFVISWIYLKINNFFSKKDLLLFFVIFLLSLPFLIFAGQDRYHLPLIPFFIIFISHFIQLKFRPNLNKVLFP